MRELEIYRASFVKMGVSTVWTCSANWHNQLEEVRNLKGVAQEMQKLAA